MRLIAHRPGHGARRRADSPAAGRGADAALGVDELLVLGNAGAGLHPADADLDDPVPEVGRCAGGLDVDEREGGVAKGSDERNRHQDVRARSRMALLRTVSPEHYYAP